MYKVTTFYHFVKLEQPGLLDAELCQFADEHQLYGLVILGVEGINATVSASDETIALLKQFLLNKPEFTGMLFKDSYSYKKPFKRFKTRIREEIVSLHDTEVVPSGVNGHLTPTVVE